MEVIIAGLLAMVLFWDSTPLPEPSVSVVLEDRCIVVGNFDPQRIAPVLQVDERVMPGLRGAQPLVELR